MDDEPGDDPTEMRYSRLSVRSQQTFRSAETVTVQKVLETVDIASGKLIAEGFNQVNFTIGVVNCLVVAHVFSVHPQHFWLLYVLEYVVLIPKKVQQEIAAKPLNKVLYFLDYCWVMNAIGSAVLVAFMATPNLTTDARKHLYMCFMGVTCGGLLGAAGLLPFVAAVFHSINYMTGVFIHVFPPMLAYTFMWHRAEIQQAWPNVFSLDYMDDVHFFPQGDGGGSIAGNAMTLYLVWFICYITWMVPLGGINLPRKNRDQPPRFDTVFHNTVRKGLYRKFAQRAWPERSMNETLQREKNDDYEVSAFVCYMLVHAFLVFLATTVLAYACWVDKRIHLALLAGLAVVCIHRGSQRYTYWATSVYGRVIQKEFGHIIACDPAGREKQQ